MTYEKWELGDKSEFNIQEALWELVKQIDRGADKDQIIPNIPKSFMPKLTEVVAEGDFFLVDVVRATAELAKQNGWVTLEALDTKAILENLNEKFAAQKIYKFEDGDESRRPYDPKVE